MNRKILVLELWGIGDLTFSTLLIREALEAGDTVHLVGKQHARQLLEPTFPGLRFFELEAGWTKFRHKYNIWEWNWGALLRLLWQLRKERYDIAVSARNDPRDHLLMALIGARRCYGFPHEGSGIFLTNPVRRSLGKRQHKVEDWRTLAAAIGLENATEASPALCPAAYGTARIDRLFASMDKPVLALHTGARIPVRRWPERYFHEVILRLRQEFDFHLILIPDPDGFGSALSMLADTVLGGLSLRELVDVIGRSDLLLCNDSGPAHLAAACGRPTIALFGPTQPDWFRPWGSQHKIVLRPICPHQPCFDYCHFPEPYCLTKLLPEHVWPEIRGHILELIGGGALPGSLQRAPAPL